MKFRGLVLLGLGNLGNKNVSLSVYHALMLFQYLLNC